MTAHGSSRGRRKRAVSSPAKLPPRYGKGRIVHHLPGRVRLKVSGLKQDPAALAHTANALRAVDGVRRIETNPTTGSVLLHYDPGLHSEMPSALGRAAEAAGLFLLESAVEGLELFEGEHSLAAVKMIDFVGAINRQVAEATGNSMDLRVLVPLGTLVLAATYLTVEMGTPFWVTLTLFAFNSFVMFHRPAPIVTPATLPGAAHV